MLTVTESAKQLLKKTLRSHSDDPETGLRLLMGSGGQFVFTLDNESEGDQVVEHEGAKVLLIALELAPVVEGLTLDVEDTNDGPKLVVSREKQD